MKGFSSHICAHIEVNTHVNLGFTAQTLAQWGLQCCSLGENGARLTLIYFEMHWTRNTMQTLVLFPLHPFSSAGSGFVAFLSLRKGGAEASEPAPFPMGITKRRLWWVCPLLPFLTLSNLAEKRMESSWPRRGGCVQGAGPGHPAVLAGQEQQGQEGSSDSHSENGLHILY